MVEHSPLILEVGRKLVGLQGKLKVIRVFAGFVLKEIDWPRKNNFIVSYIQDFISTGIITVSEKDYG